MLKKIFFLIFPFIALLEITGHFFIKTRIPSPKEWNQLKKALKKRYQKGDIILIAPLWISPLARYHLKDMISLKEMGRSDLEGYKRAWEISLEKKRVPELKRFSLKLEKNFGSLTLRLYKLKPSKVIYDFLDHIPEAEVKLSGYPERNCLWREKRWVCDFQKSWNYVGPIMIADLHLKPRYCLWAHPVARKKLEIIYPQVLLGNKLVIYGGFAYIAAREGKGFPVIMDVFIDNKLLGHFLFHDLDGWKKETITTSHLKKKKAKVIFKIYANSVGMRHFCFYSYAKD